MKKGNKEIISLSIEPTLLSNVDLFCKWFNVSRSVGVRMLLSYAFTKAGHSEALSDVNVNMVEIALKRNNDLD